MISPEEDKYILSKAYVPEHVISLMAPISKGEPFLINGYLCFSKNNLIIIVGYPLDHDFSAEDFGKILDDTVRRFRPEHVRLIASEIHPSLNRFCRERESDYYYKLELTGAEIKKDLMRLVKRASRDLNVDRGRDISKEHKELISEFIEREKPGNRITALFLSMQEYVTCSKTAVVLNARDKKQNLSAFYVVELAAEEFATYVVGCHSKKNYTPGLSDLLFFEMINLAREYSKNYIHLGLGVNKGIRRFKEKWGGVQFLRYESCEYDRGGNKALKLLRALESKL